MTTRDTNGLQIYIAEDQKEKTENLDILISPKQSKQLSEGELITSKSEDEIFGTLPGQARSSSQEIDTQTGYVVRSSSSSEGFDLKKFRIGDTNQRQGDNNNGKSKTIDSSQDEINIWGIRFILQHIYERYKDPVQYLQLVYGTQLINNIGTCIVYLIGLKFRIFILILCAVHFVLSLIVITSAINSSIKLGFKFSKQVWLQILCACASLGALSVYGFAFETPFDSMPVYLLLLFVLFFFALFAFAMIVQPNDREWSDPNYQIRFLFSRLLMAFFNATGLVLSDIALSLDLIRFFKGYVFVVGIFLLGFCMVDYLLLIFRILMPSKVTIRRHLMTILIEVVVIILTISVVYGVRKNMDDGEQGKEDSFAIIVISIATTMVNFLHHIFLVYDQCLANSVVHANLSIMRG
eukprot:TRINITY_DN25016_c0_g1_i1.p1 TRINITY_DN25016_c0_g1~~TRINITY_DN25016_c0_g1_i1.p1  ORF type:complete len:408 (-),score=17.59 TRINITY_DN25016_c0_g1_i1:354-1577(-)